MDISMKEIANGEVSPARLANLLQGSTYATLLVEYGRTMVPLRDIAESVLGMAPERACVLASRGEIMVPSFKAGGPRSPWLVHLWDLAQHVDAQRVKAGSRYVLVEEDESNRVAVEEAGA